jgi:isoquinoline 1-oxidoreductase subunit alpha
MNVTLQVNGTTRTVEVDEETPLLWVLRESLGLTGTKFGCGVGACGACTVHVDGSPARSCSVETSALQGRAITTIEGIGSESIHRVQQAWIDHQVPQCGYCQSGMIMAVVALLASKPQPSDADIDEQITNLCRCGTYERVRRAIHAAAAATSLTSLEEPRLG